MAGEDPYNALGQPPKPLLGAPRANYDPFGAGQMAPGGMGMQMALYAPQLLQSIFGISKFIPEQSPSQLLMDQMTSAKYMQNAVASRESVREIDQRAVFSRIEGVSEKLGFGPSTPLGAKYMNQFAGLMNSDFGQAMAGSLIGPQNVEDLFFGRRGSAVQLANAVNQIGFSRPDSVYGGDRMSGESLQQFTEQLYGNLYGPGANLNDISGLSAGRVGAMATDLAQRGLLPQSIGSMTESAKMDTLRDKSLRPADFEESIAREIADETYTLQNKKFDTPDGKKVGYNELDKESRRKIIEEEVANASSPFRQSAAQVSAKMDDPSASFEDVLDLPGGAAGVRKIDATKVSNTLKEYSGVVASVRAIFGDNGMGNAPMSQLIAALDALSQGGMASMGAGKLENIMRRTQMASRDGGVSLEALMGLTARGGALADQYGVVRDAVPEAVIGAMERGRAMKDVGAFAPGFGKMTPDEAMLFALDQNVRSDASTASKLASTANRIVAENKGNDAFAGKAKDLIAFTEAMKRGASTFVTESGETVNIAQEMGRNPQQFFQRMFEQAGISDEEVEARYYDATNTQEYLVPGQVAAAQRYEAIQGSADSFFEDFMRREKGQNIPEERRKELALAMGESVAAAMIDEVDTSMAPEERVQVVKNALRRGIEQDVRRKNPKMSDEDVQKETQRLFIGADGIFATEEEALSYAGMAQADVGRDFEGRTGMNINRLRQTSSLEVQVATEQRSRRNRAKADLASRVAMGGDGSNFIQRFSDALVDGGGVEGLVAATLGAVDTDAHLEELLDAVGGEGTLKKSLGVIKDEYSTATIDTEDERNAVIQQTFERSSEEGGRMAFNTALRKEHFAELKGRFKGVPGADSVLEGKDTAITTKELAENITAQGDKSAEMSVIRQMYKEKTGKSDTEIDAIFANQETRDLAVQEVVKRDGFRQLFTENLAKTLPAEQLSERVNALGLGGNVALETEVRELIEQNQITAGDTPQERQANAEKMARTDKLIREMGSGKVQASTIMDVMGGDIKDEKQRETVQKAMEEALKQADDTVIDEKGERSSKSMSALSKTLTDAGIVGEEQEKMLAVVEHSRGLQIVGGMDSYGSKAISEKMRQQTRLNAILTSDVKGGQLGDLLEKYNTAETPEEKAAALDELKKSKAISGSDEDFEEGLSATNATAESRKKIQEQVAKQSSAVDSATAAAQGGGGPFAGIIAQLGESISSAFAQAVSENFKDLKIENVTITNLNMNAANLLGSLFSGLKGALDDVKPSADKAKEANEAGLEKKTKVDRRDETTTTNVVVKEDKTLEQREQKTTEETKTAVREEAEKGKRDEKNEESADKTAQSGTETTAIEQIVAALKYVTGNLTQTTGSGLGGQSKQEPAEFTGTLKITGMNSAIAHLVPRQLEQTPDGGAPIPTYYG